MKNIAFLLLTLFSSASYAQLNAGILNKIGGALQQELNKDKQSSAPTSTNSPSDALQNASQIDITVESYCDLLEKNEALNKYAKRLKSAFDELPENQRRSIAIKFDVNNQIIDWIFQYRATQVDPRSVKNPSILIPKNTIIQHVMTCASKFAKSDLFYAFPGVIEEKLKPNRQSNSDNRIEFYPSKKENKSEPPKFDENGNIIQPKEKVAEQDLSYIKYAMSSIRKDSETNNAIFLALALKGGENVVNGVGDSAKEQIEKTVSAYQLRLKEEKLAAAKAGEEKRVKSEQLAKEEEELNKRAAQVKKGNYSAAKGCAEFYVGFMDDIKKSLMSPTPQLQPNGQFYIYKGKLRDFSESEGVLQNADKFARYKTSSKTIFEGKNFISTGEVVTVFGYYNENTKLKFATGATQTIPIFDALCISGINIY